MPYHPPIPDPKSGPKGSGLVSALVQAEKLVQIALVLPCAAFVGWLIGDWIGIRLHVPLLGAAGVALGGAAGLYYVIRLALDSLKNTPDGGSGDESGKSSAGKSS